MSSSGRMTGFGQDVAFVGEMDPTSTVLCITLAIQGTIVIEADLPIEPQGHESSGSKET